MNSAPRVLMTLATLIGICFAMTLWTGTTGADDTETGGRTPTPSTPPDAIDVHDLTTMEDMTQNQRVLLQGFYQPGDGGEGLFRYRARSQQPHDGGIVIAPGAPNPADDLQAYLNFKPSQARGRWVRQSDHAHTDVRWYGAHADGEHDDAPAINHAIAFLHNHDRPGETYIPAGTYRLNSQIFLRANVNLRGAGINATYLHRDDSKYLIQTGDRGPLHATVSHMTLQSPHYVAGCDGVSYVNFQHVRFRGGIVRFTGSQFMRIEHCEFHDTVGKSAYASDACTHVTITNNLIRNAELGGINLSRHSHSVVSNNIIVKDQLPAGSTGYGAIRLPNDAQFNTVTGNVITNHPRGIFVLSGSSHNTISNNVVDGAEQQAVLVQSDHNIVANNIISNPDADAALIQIHKANGNIVLANQLTTDTADHAALVVSFDSRNNQVLNNVIDASLPLSASAEARQTNTFTNNTDVRR
ncbi:MAG: NosD domain-containing protein [Phycisphaeraceae bacterium]